jgi:hypothetical protein
MRNNQIRITLALAFAVASLGSLAGPVSSASAHTWHHRWSYLHFPASSNFVQCVPPRRIHLAGGRYVWRAFTYHWAHPNNPRDTWTTGPRLGGGWYLWNDCLKRFRERGRYIYHLTGILQQQATGLRLYNDGLFHRGRYGDGRYHWGSTLDRVR